MSVVRLDRYRDGGRFDSRSGYGSEAADVFQDEQAYDRDHLATVIEMYENAEEASRKSRQKAERDVDYYDGKQLTKTEYDALVKRGQSPHVDNRVKRKIRYMEGLEQQKRTDPRALPRTPQHEEDAQSVTDCLRYVTEENSFDLIRSACWKDMLCWGWAGYETTFEQAQGRQNAKVIIRRCQPDRMFWDPHSEADDFEDARFRGLFVWGDRDMFTRKYGKKAGKVFDETVAGFGAMGETYDDKPRFTTWVALTKRKRARIVQLYYQTASGVWHFCEFTKGGFLGGGVSPWLGEDGRPEHPYSWGSANVDRDNNRYGEIRDMVDPQDAINKRQSKFLHFMSVRQTFGNELAMGSMTVRELREQAARPDGHFSLGANVEFNKHFGIVPTTDMAEGQFQLLQQAIAEMDLQGPNAAMQGKDPRTQSGRAIMVQQQGGELESNPTFDVLRHMDNDCYKRIWKRIRQSWTGPDYVRVTDDEKNVKWVGINMPKQQHVMGPGGQPMLDPRTGRAMLQPMIDPQTGQPMMQNELGKLEVDIIMDEAPHVGTLQQEEFLGLVELAKAGIPIPPRAIIKASGLRSKYDILKELDQQAQNPNPNPEMVKAQAKMAETQAKIGAQREKTQMDAAAAQQDAQLKAATQAQESELKQRESQARLVQDAAHHAAQLQQQQALANQKMEIERQQAGMKMQLEQQKTQSQLGLEVAKGHVQMQQQAQMADHERQQADRQAVHEQRLAERQTQASIRQADAVSRAKASAIRSQSGPKKTS